MVESVAFSNRCCTIIVAREQKCMSICLERRCWLLLDSRRVRRGSQYNILISRLRLRLREVVRKNISEKRLWLPGPLAPRDAHSPRNITDNARHIKLMNEVGTSSRQHKAIWRKSCCGLYDQVQATPPKCEIGSSTCIPQSRQQCSI